ncbi:MAG: signal peptidase I [Helicobacteraceae bacterium]|jgi:signal peptidase I|nr:signal peptidase I [Helicobacteraceae bacterium]
MTKLKKALIWLYHFSNTWTGTVIIVLFAIFFFAQAFVIPSGSMKNTFHEGDHLIVKKFVYGIPIPHIPWLEVPVLPDFDGDGHLIAGDGPKRGDVVVFRYPNNPKAHYIKRCVAVEGDGVMLRGDKLYIRPHEGADFVKANYLQEQIALFGDEYWVLDPYIADHRGIQYDYIARSTGLLPTETVSFGPITVPKGRYFMMGDNRDHSNDSRFWGSVPYEYIVGAPWFVYFSWEPRSFDEIARRGVFDYSELKSVCGDDIEPISNECRAKWDKERYKVRWDRIGRAISGIENRL